MTLMATSEAPKERTKAKQRYLKRKKERRKQKPKIETNHEDGARPLDPINPSNQNAESPQTQVVYESKKTQRPVKRPRLEVEDVAVLDDLVAEEMEIDEPVGDFEPSIKALPSFPLPSLPDAPSKSVLALQGLDQALIDADVVHPSTILPIPDAEDDDGGTRLSAKIRKRLKSIGITELFAVQTSLLPFLLPHDPLARRLYLPYDPPRDVCISAPTGSGKTLAYVLPIVETLSPRIVTRLRALVVLPTRDLVSQVRETFEAITNNRGLKIGTATGQNSFAHEQAQLVNNVLPSIQGGSSKVDILICTPGRLMDHLMGTPNFSLQHLRFLVIDEADRLLAQSFQDWLSRVLAATRPHVKSSSSSSSPSPHSLPESDGLSPAFLQRLSLPDIPAFQHEEKETSCQKLLFSATLTRDPAKIAALNLRDPKYFIVQSRTDGEELHVLENYSMPPTLTEHMIVSNSSKKPLVFFHLIHRQKMRNVLVFTKSADSTTRLVRLFEFFEEARLEKEPGTAGEESIIARAYSSDLPPSERKAILDQFKAQQIHILICSDLISRGIDITHVSHVVNYDVPVDMRKYVHRVGRTARAGRAGDAWTLVEEQEARYFKQMLSDADHLKKVNRMRVSDKDLDPLLASYTVALEKLKEVYTKSG